MFKFLKPANHDHMYFNEIIVNCSTSRYIRICADKAIGP